MKITGWLIISIWGLLVVSGVFCLPNVYAQTGEVQWMKDRVQRMHANYRGAGDHDNLLYKMQCAKEKLVSPEARRALDLIIERWEELRPQTIRSGVSSIPVERKKEEIVEKVEQVQEIEEVKEVVAGQKDIEGVTVGRYQLDENRYIDLDVLQKTWLSWLNDLRAERGRSPIQLEPVLHKTAADRSETMKQKGVGDHRRFKNSAYYAYGEIEQWFADRGVSFVNVSRATFTENIGRSTFRCKKTDCTTTAIEAMRQTWKFYLSEEGTKNDAHWRTIMHPLFKIVGLGIAVDEGVGKFYLTTHYGTQVK